MAPLPPLKNGFSWKFAIALLGGLVLVAQLVLLVVWKWDGFNHTTRMRDFDEFVSLDPRDHPHSAEQMVEDPERERVQEIACNKKTDRCFYVVDGPARWGSGLARSLMVVPLKEMVIAEVRLERPEGEGNCPPRLFSNASQGPALLRWHDIDMDHAKVIAAQPFIHHTFPSMPQLLRDVPTKQLKMLFFGLGGSLPLCNYFSQAFGESATVTVVEPDPTVEYLAKKWFGVGAEVEGAQQDVYLDEGSNFLAARPMGTPEYDFVVVNDCYYTREESAQCPKKGYARPITAARLRESMNEGGTLVINVFSLSNARANVGDGGDGGKKRHWAQFEHQLLELYNRYFHDTCYYVKVAANMILSCKKTSGKEQDVQGKMTQLEYSDKFQAAGLPVEWQQFVDFDGAKIIQDIEAP